jgi:TPR repeat protein
LPSKTEKKVPKVKQAKQPKSTTHKTLKNGIKGCDRLNAQDCYSVGKRYELGKGVGANHSISQIFYKKSCRLGYTKACKK